MVYKNSGEVLSKLNSRGIRATSLYYTYDFSTLYTTLPHNLIRKNFLDLIEIYSKRFSKMKARFILLVTIRKRFSLLQTIEDIKFGLVRMYVDSLSYLLYNIYIRLGNKLKRQIFGIPMGTNCAPLVADLFFILL